MLATFNVAVDDDPLNINEPPLSVASNVVDVRVAVPPSEPKFVHAEPLYELLFVASRYTNGLYVKAFFTMDTFVIVFPVIFDPIWFH